MTPNNNKAVVGAAQTTNTPIGNARQIVLTVNDTKFTINRMMFEGGIEPTSKKVKAKLANLIDFDSTAKVVLPKEISVETFMKQAALNYEKFKAGKEQARERYMEKRGILPTEEKAKLVLSMYKQGKSVSEIAASTKMSEQSVNKLLNVIKAVMGQ